MQMKFVLLFVLALFAVALGANPKVVDQVFFDVSIGGKEAGRIIIGLYDNTPKTATNFLEIANGYQTKDGRVLTYKNSPFHRIIPNFMIQGGDITRGNGMGGESIYGNRFADENFINKHDKPFLLSMANAGPNTNGSQFFITTVPTPWLNGKHVVFGEVSDAASQAVVKAIEAVGTGSGTPREKVVVTNSGVIKN